MKIRTLCAVAALTACTAVNALPKDMPPKPDHCPSASALKSQPFFLAQKPENAPGYMALSVGKYQTNDLWGFVMGFIEADDMMSALLIANKALPGVAGDPEPMPIEQQKVWACMYGVRDTSYQAIAVTPLKGPGATSIPNVSRFLK